MRTYFRWATLLLISALCVSCSSETQAPAAAVQKTPDPLSPAAAAPTPTSAQQARMEWLKRKPDESSFGADASSASGE
jgi:hypothetical protein